MIIIRGKDKKTGKIVYDQSYGGMTPDTREYIMADLSKQHPNLEWEYEYIH